MYAIGFDLGTSSAKCSLLDLGTGQCLASAYSPEIELPIQSPQAGWAEQNPETWWEHLGIASRKVMQQSGIAPEAVKAIGVSYQMHGLVLLDEAHRVLRPSILWCDSRAVPYGARVLKAHSEADLLQRYLNLPGNFTASKLLWVKENEPELYAKTKCFLLPGDYLAFRMTGIPGTTESGLSEAILWDYQEQTPAFALMEAMGLDPSKVAPLLPTFGMQGALHAEAAAHLGLATGTPLCYRAGDVVNMAFSMDVNEPGQSATTAGTAGIAYVVSEKPLFDLQSRINAFVHVTNTKTAPRNGLLICTNAAGRLNSWLRNTIFENASYRQLDEWAAAIPPGSDGLRCYPYGNGAERTLANQEPGASFDNLNFNIHGKGHLLRAAQEGIVFALYYGLELLREMGLQVSEFKAGNANMFMSPVFREAYVNTTNATLTLYDTDGSQGSARGAALGAGLYTDRKSAYVGLKIKSQTSPDSKINAAYFAAYQEWKKHLPL
jgi:xylulokinase